MIMPRATSPLRPVITAFYITFYQSRPEWGKDRFIQTLRDILIANGSRVTSLADELDLIIDGQIGVVILPSTQQLTEEMRRHVRQVLTGGTPEVTLIMAFTPQPRLARVNAPRRANEQERQEDNGERNATLP